MKQGKPLKIDLRRSFSASLETVFDAWLIPYLAGSWMFGPKSLDQEVLALENEPRKDGRFILAVKRDGRKQQFTGQYKEIRRPEKLVCSWGTDEKSAALNKLTLTLESADGKTRMRLTHEMDASLANTLNTRRGEWDMRCKALADLVEESNKQARLFK